MRLTDVALPPPQLDSWWSQVVVDPASGCWIWQGNTKNGYGCLRRIGARNRLYVHRLFYEALVGPVPRSLVLDHLCETKICCNPYHLEAVSSAANLQRWHASYKLVTRVVRRAG